MVRSQLILIVPLILSTLLRTAESFSFKHDVPPPLKPPRLRVRRTAALASTTSTTQIPSDTLTRIPINEEYAGLHLIHSDPDIYTLSDFLDAESCDDLIRRARDKTMSQSPVAYAGWTDDVKVLLELAAKGPVAWIALVTAWLQVRDAVPAAGQIELLVRVLENYATGFVVAAAGIVAYTKFRTDGLQALRTSTSTTLDDLEDGRGSAGGGGGGKNGPAAFVTNAAELFDSESPVEKEARLFEAPTVIRYEPGQVLAPHFDANRSAETEDANRGGQTLATLIVYLNDVEEGGLTRFGRLRSTGSGGRIGETGTVEEGEEDGFVTVRPKRGDALLFFPADRDGVFDERVEHEGCAAVDEKWIARIWRHIDRVPPPYGMSNDAIVKL